jgi:hypothetical protein
MTPKLSSSLSTTKASALGMMLSVSVLVSPIIPDITGLGSFAGTQMHSVDYA